MFIDLTDLEEEPMFSVESVPLLGNRRFPGKHVVSVGQTAVVEAPGNPL